MGAAYTQDYATFRSVVIPKIQPYANQPAINGYVQFMYAITDDTRLPFKTTA